MHPPPSLKRNQVRACHLEETRRKLTQGLGGEIFLGRAAESDLAHMSNTAVVVVVGCNRYDPLRSPTDMWSCGLDPDTVASFRFWHALVCQWKRVSESNAALLACSALGTVLLFDVLNSM